MSEQDVDVSDAGTDGTTDTGADPAVGGQVKALQAERARRQELESQLAALKQAQADREREAAEKAGEYERLYTEAAPKLKQYEERIAAYEAREAKRIEAVAARNEERIGKLPDHLKSLAPSGDDADALSDWLDRAMAAAGTERPAGTQVGGGNVEIPQECRDEAIRLGIDPLKWFQGGWRKRNKSR